MPSLRPASVAVAPPRPIAWSAKPCAGRTSGWPRRASSACSSSMIDRNPRNSCHICVAMHTARLTALGADPGLITALRDPDRAEPLADERLDAVRVFTVRVLDTAGDVGDRALRDFLAAGYTTENALEVVLGIGTYTMSTLANRLTGAPVDEQLAAYA